MPFQSTINTSRSRRKAPPQVESSSVSSQDNSEEHQRHEDAVPLLDGHHTSSRPHHSSTSSNSVIVSPSVRALAALRGSPLPISPGRVEAEAARRTSSIPRSRLRSPSNALGSLKRSTYPSSTAKTADLIEAFPEPPHARIRIRNSAPARMSLFPNIAQLEERDSDISGQTPEGREYNTTGSASEQSTLPRVDSARSPSASNAWLSGALPNPPEVDGSADTTASNSRPVRGEDVRYRHSGTPVYNSDTVSLREIDMSDDHALAASLSPPGSPVSGKTGATRFFSAASQLRTIATRQETSTPVSMAPNAHVQARGENRVQQERAVANGALRFISQTHSGNEPVQSVREEVDVPVTVTSHGRACLHKRGSVRSPRSDRCEVDGAQEGEDKQSRSGSHCLICRAKRIMYRFSRSARSRDHPTPVARLRRRNGHLRSLLEDEGVIPRAVL